MLKVLSRVCLFSVLFSVCYALYTTLYKVYFDQRNTTNARCASEMETFVSGETINSLDEAAGILDKCSLQITVTVSADEEAVDNGDGDECSMSTSCTNWSSRTHSIILSLEQSCVLLGGMGTFTLLFMGFGMAPLDFFSIEKVLLLQCKCGLPLRTFCLLLRCLISISFRGLQRPPGFIYL